MSFDTLPTELLHQILRATDQGGRVACLTACKALSAAARQPAGCWPAVTLRDLDRTAVAFVARHRCRHVTIKSDTPDDVSWFLQHLAAAGAADCVDTLTLALGVVQRLPSDLLASVGLLPRLRYCALSVQDLETACDLAWERDMPCLEGLVVQERSEGGKQLVVWFGRAAFPVLRRAVLDVGLTDVMAAARKMPALRDLVYRCDDDDSGETYEDAALEGVTLDTLELDLGVDTDYRHLGAQLREAAVRTLVLHLHDDWVPLEWAMPRGLQTLRLCMHLTHIDVKLDFVHLRQCATLTHLDVQIGARWISDTPALLQGCRHSLSFHHVPCYRDWARLFVHEVAGAAGGGGRAVQLTMPPTTSVTITPV